MLLPILIITLFLVLLVALLNIGISVKVHFDDNSDFKCTISYLFIKYRLLPKDEEKSRRKEAKKRKKQEKLLKKGKKIKEKAKISFKDMFKEKGIRGFLEDIKTLVKSLWSLILSVISRAKIMNLDLKMNVVGTDAADTAIIYGYTNAVVFPIVSALIENVYECKDYNVDIVPDFSEDAEASVNLDIHVKIKPIKLIAAILENRASAEKLLNTVSKKSNDKKEK